MKYVPWVIIALAAFFGFINPKFHPSMTEALMGIFLAIVARMVQVEAHHRGKANKEL